MSGDRSGDTGPELVIGDPLADPAQRSWRLGGNVFPNPPCAPADALAHGLRGVPEMLSDLAAIEADLDAQPPGSPSNRVLWGELGLHAVCPAGGVDCVAVLVAAGHLVTRHDAVTCFERRGRTSRGRAKRVHRPRSCAHQQHHLRTRARLSLRRRTPELERGLLDIVGRERPAASARVQTGNCGRECIEFVRRCGLHTNIVGRSSAPDHAPKSVSCTSRGAVRATPCGDVPSATAARTQKVIFDGH